MDPSVLEQMFGMNPAQQMKLLEDNKKKDEAVPILLENICTTLVMGFEEYLRSYDASRGLQTFVDIGQNYVKGRGDVATLTLRAMALVLEHVPNSNDAALANPLVMQTAAQILKSADGLLYEMTSMPNCVEEALRIVNFVAQEDTYGVVVSSGIITTIVDISKHLDSRSIKTCLDCLTQICRKLVFKNGDIQPPSEKKKAKKGTPAPAKVALKASSIELEVKEKLIPHLHSVLTNGVLTAVVGDQWPIIESSAKCISVLCERLAEIGSQIIPSLVTSEIVDTLLEALLNVAQLDAKRLDVLYVLVNLARGAPAVVWKQLTTPNGIKFMAEVLETDSKNTDITSLLDEPFAKVTKGSSASNRDSKSNPKSMLVLMAIMLVTVCVDDIPHDWLSSGFTVLPIHRWSWEDDVHSFTDYNMAHCINIETSRHRKEKTAQIHAGGTTYTIDFTTMKQSRGERARNVRRSDVPRSFEIVVLSEGNSVGGPCGVGDLPVAHTLNIATRFLVNFVPLVIQRASGSSNEMLLLLSAKALMQAIHACLPADEAFLVAIGELEGPLMEFLSDLLNSKTDEVVDIAMIICDLLFHHRGLDWGFPSKCKRFSIIQKLRTIASRSDGLEGRAAFLAEVIETCQSPNAAHSPSMRNTPLGAALNLFANASGDFQEAYLADLLVNLNDAKQLTCMEFEGLGVANAILAYLTKAPSAHRPVQADGSPLRAGTPDKGLCESSSFQQSNSSFGSPMPSNGSFAAAGSGARSTTPPPTPQNHALDAPADTERVKKFVEQMEKNPGCMEVLVNHLIAVLSTHHRNEPEVECLTTTKNVACRSVPDALTVLAAMSPTCELCSNREEGDDGAPVQIKAEHLQSHETCPAGHKLVEHVSHSWVCDVCGGRGEKSMCCRECDFDICMDCYENPEDSGYEGAPLVGGSTTSGLKGKKTHILSTMGDIEKGLTGGQMRGNVRQGLQGLRGELETMITALHQRVAGSGGGGDDNPRAALGGRLEALLMERTRQIEEAEEQAATEDQEAISSAGSRTQLYYEGVGRVPFHEPLFSVLFRKAFNRKIFSALEVFETGLMQLESSSGKKRSGGKITNANPSAKALSEFSAVAPTKVRTLFMHVFNDVDEPKCSCGELARESYAVEHPALLRRRPAPVSLLPEFTLLHLLHQINEKSKFLQPEQFTSTELTSKIIRSAAACALRVAVLPAEFALPRWLLNITTNYQFLVPVAVRRKLVSYVTFGARKSLWSAIQHLGHHTISPSNFDIISLEWQGGGSPNRRQQLNKHVVKRETLLTEAEAILKFSAELRTPLTIEFQGDAGTGLGPTVQFFTMIATELCKARRNLWRWDGAHRTFSGEGAETLIDAPVEGLFPLPRHPSDHTPADILRCMQVAGMALARGLMDGRVFPLPLSAMMFSYLRLMKDLPSAFGDHLDTDDLRIEFVDKGLASIIDSCYDMQLKYKDAIDEDNGEDVRQEILEKFKAMDLVFTLPGHENIPLCEKGDEKELTPENTSSYCVATTTTLLIHSVRTAVAAFLRGFSDTLPVGGLNMLTSQELLVFMCGVDPNAGPLWTLDEMMSCVVASHGYSKDSPQVGMLVETVSLDFTPLQQSAFLSFCTGCPRLPIGGIKALGHITVVKKELPAASESNAASPANLQNASSATFEGSPAGPSNSSSAFTLDMGLPSVNTCFKYVKLPPYPNKDMLKERLLKAIEESGDSFELS